MDAFSGSSVALLRVTKTFRKGATSVVRVDSIGINTRAEMYCNEIKQNRKLYETNRSTCTADAK